MAKRKNKTRKGNMTAKVNKSLNSFITIRAGDVEKNCSAIVEKVAEEYKWPKSMRETISGIISEGCKQLNSGMGFCDSDPILRIDFTDIPMIVRALDFDILSYKKEYTYSGDHVHQIEIGCLGGDLMTMHSTLIYSKQNSFQGYEAVGNKLAQSSRGFFNSLYVQVAGNKPTDSKRKSFIHDEKINPTNQAQIEKIIKELEEMSVTATGFEDDRSAFMGDRHDRTKELGQKLHEIGGLRLMQITYSRIKFSDPGDGDELTCAWHKVGDWQW